MGRRSRRLTVCLLCLHIIVQLTQCNDRNGGTSSDHNEPPVNYRGHAVIRAEPQNDEHLYLLASLPHHQKFATEVELWKHPSVVRHHVDMRVAPRSVPSLLQTLTAAGLPHHIIADDLHKLIEAERAGRRDDVTLPPQHLNLSHYHTYDSIMRWLDYVCSAARNGSSCETFIIGKSSEQRDLKVIKIGATDMSKPAIWIDAGMHAREWIAPATALHVINKLLDRSNRIARRLVRQYRWYILPLANPDGYAYTWTTDRLWRKTRSRHPDPDVRCRGVDSNRNWNFHWNGPGSSKDPCSEQYNGWQAFCEPETRAISDFILSLTAATSASNDDNYVGGLDIYVSLHSYGQHLLTPWGYTRQLPPDYLDLVTVGQEVVDVLRRTHGEQFTVGPASRIMYVASGSSGDWVKAVAGVKYTYTVELRDVGTYGFLLPPEYIDVSGRETVSALNTLTAAVRRRRRRQQVFGSTADR